LVEASPTIACVKSDAGAFMEIGEIPPTARKSPSLRILVVDDASLIG
jgi:hypothetical protein